MLLKLVIDMAIKEWIKNVLAALILVGIYVALLLFAIEQLPDPY